jgi:NADPH:quinone reductase-like Zn-dependent oxidoreductase
MALMQAVHFTRFGPPEVLTLGSLPEPHAAPGEIRIRVRSAGISPVDLSIRAGTSPAGQGLALPHIPGVDAAGVVDEVGAEVTGVTPGDEVFGTVSLRRLGGATAEFAVLSFWSPKPPAMPWTEAGAAGTSIETATRALDLLALEPGMTLLVDGAAGGVGSVVILLAIARGATVIGTGRPSSHDFLAALGALPIAYGPGLPDRVTGHVDRALDVAGAGSLPELITLAGTPEAVVTLADFRAPALGVRISVGELGAQPHGRHGLALAAALAEEGRFHVPIQAVFPMSRAPEAHRAAEHHPRQGKLAITMAA